ncbi:MAG: hypothetical protein LBU31_00245 [Coriobacteriales bacterium]|nr:hypothetical protein [Coriobacteriales bacterium]
MLIWGFSIFQIVSIGSSVVGAQGSDKSLATVFDVFMNTDGIVTACAGLVVGLVAYGIGEVIGLLNDIRGNTRL